MTKAGSFIALLLAVAGFTACGDTAINVNTSANMRNANANTAVFTNATPMSTSRPMNTNMTTSNTGNMGANTNRGGSTTSNMNANRPTTNRTP